MCCCSTDVHSGDNSPRRVKGDIARCATGVVSGPFCPRLWTIPGPESAPAKGRRPTGSHNTSDIVPDDSRTAGPTNPQTARDQAMTWDSEQERGKPPTRQRHLATGAARWPGDSPARSTALGSIPWSIGEKPAAADLGLRAPRTPTHIRSYRVPPFSTKRCIHVG